MAERRTIIHEPSGTVLVQSAKWCNSFGTKLRGMMFKRSLAEDEGLVLVEKRESRVATSIHMLFVPFDLGVIWVNSAGEIVDTVVAKPWALQYAPKEAAQYVIELHPSLLEKISIGDQIIFQ